MKDVELVIKIPESRYKLLQIQAGTDLGRIKLDEFAEAVLNGTPLPKGHGRLIDADAMFKDICNSIESMTNIGIAVDGQYLWRKLNDALFNAPTIIAADKVGSEDSE